MESTLKSLGHRLSVIATPNPKEVPGPDYGLVAKDPDTALIATLGIMNPKYIAGLTQFNRPIVAIDYDGAGAKADAVVFDSFGAGRLLAAHLLELGHTKIGFMGRNRGPNTQGMYRPEPDSLKLHAGVELSLKEYGLMLPAEWDIETNMNFDEEVCVAVRKMMNSPERPTALVISSSWHATKVIETVKEMGFGVPGDLSITAYAQDEDIPAHEIPVTTVTFQMGAMGEVAGRVIASRLENTEQPAVLVNIPGRLIVRDTTNSVSGENGEMMMEPTRLENLAPGREI